MIQTYKELVEATLAKYEGATNLSKQSSRNRCYYAPQIEGSVGCAIGCHLDPEWAKVLDSFSMSDGGSDIKALARDTEARNILEQAIALDAFDINALVRFQNGHDKALDVDDFRDWLRAELRDIEDGGVDATTGQFVVDYALPY